MMSVANLMRDLAMEMQDPQDTTDPVIEDLEATDEVVTEIEESLDRVSEIVEQQMDAEETSEVLADTVESLESSLNMIQSFKEAGERFNGVSMRLWVSSIVDSMEARKIPVEVYESLTEGMDMSFESVDTYTDYSMEAEQKGQSIWTRIWSMLKAAYAKVKEFLGKLFAWFGKSADSIIKGGKKLQEVSKKIDQFKKPNPMVVSKKYKAITTADNSVDPFKALKEASDAFTVANRASTDVYISLTESAKLLKGATPNQLDFVKLQVGKLARGILAENTFSNKKISVNQETGKITTSELDRNPKEKSDPLTVKGIEALGTELIKFGEMVKKAMADAKSTEKKIDTSLPPHPDPNMRYSYNEEGLKVLRRVNQGFKFSKDIRVAFSRAAIDVAAKAYAYGIASAKLYGKGSKDGTTQAPAPSDSLRLEHNP